jgi:hypothetical protein
MVFCIGDRREMGDNEITIINGEKKEERRLFSYFGGLRSLHLGPKLSFLMSVQVRVCVSVYV